MNPPFEPKDRNGRRIRVGNRVRVIGIPNLRGMSKEGRAESLPVFRYLIGKYKRIAEFDEYGLARLDFAIRRGRHRGWHGVMIEPFLLHLPQRSNNALLTDTYTSPLRARRGAAKRGR
jgi:hypothetical protein